MCKELFAITVIPFIIMFVFGYICVYFSVISDNFIISSGLLIIALYSGFVCIDILKQMFYGFKNLCNK